MLPALLLSFWLVLQYAIVMHVRHVAHAAAQDAALAAASARRPGAGAGDDRRHRRSMTSGVGVGPAADGDEVIVTVRAEVLQVFPIGDFDVTVSAAAPIERFIPQPERP